MTIAAFLIALLVFVGFFQNPKQSLNTALAYVSHLLNSNGPRGILSLEPPQVYTRERLVNDRFRQANWLENQLASTNDTATIEQIGRVLSSIRRETGVSLELTTKNTGSAAKEPALSGGATPLATAADAGSFGQRLVETDKLRTLLRTDLMDTLLDDGHDLQGNTLYRLNFDAVVMPFSDLRWYPGNAVFVIRARNPFGPLSLESCQTVQDTQDLAGLDDAIKNKCAASLPRFAKDDLKTYLETLQHNQLRDDIEMLRDWQTEIQQFLTRVVENRIEDFKGSGRLDNPVDPREDIALDWYLRRELIESFLAAIVLDPDVAALCKRQNAALLKKEETDLGRSNVCKNWISKNIGLKWQSDNRIPDFDFTTAVAPGIEVAFRRGIRLAEHINRVREKIGQEEYQREQGKQDEGRETNTGKTPDENVQSTVSQRSCAASDTGSRIPLTIAAQQCDTPPPEDPPAHETSKKNGDNEGYVDPDQKKALLRMIAVWHAMGERNLRQPFETGDKDSDPKPASDVPPPPLKNDEAAKILFAILNEYDVASPNDQDIKDAETDLRSDVGSVRSLNAGIERCHAPSQEKRGSNAQLDFYKCALIHAQATRTAENLITKFVLARLKNELPIYKKRDHSSLSNFIDVELAGCGTTGCRIQVTQFSDIPTRDLTAGWEIAADTSDVSNLLQIKEANATIPKDAIATITEALSDKDASSALTLDNKGMEIAEWTAAQNVIVHIDKNPLVYENSLNAENKVQRPEVLKCLKNAEQYSDTAIVRTEAYFACRLRHWVNTTRSDLTVYGVSPRAGSGDDLISSMETQYARLNANAAAAGTGTARIGATDNQIRTQVQSHPTVIGFSNAPGRQERNHPAIPVDQAVFGWAIRPEELASGEGYSASRQRLSAVISVPSWWKRVDFDVVACWKTPSQIRELTRNAKGGDTQGNAFDRLCSDEDIAVSGIARNFEIQLPRRVEEITERFNFDFIKTPYLYRDFTDAAIKNIRPLTMEAGRPGELVLHGERLWRGTFVTVNNQPADRIVVLPDMKGVVASFKCVRPPDGSLHMREYAPNSDTPPPPPVKQPLFVWTSQGNTDPLDVVVYPFIQRVKDEKPCWSNPD